MERSQGSPLLFSSGVIKYMRETKFRVWDLDNQQMFYQDKPSEMNEVWEMNETGIRMLTLELIDRCDGGEHVQTEEYRAWKQVLMQYTGLKDKNGKEIYEGDVVEYNAYGTWHKDEVKFSNGKFHGQLSGVRDDLQSNYDLGLIETLGCEIIGNIYESEHLLDNTDMKV